MLATVFYFILNMSIVSCFVIVALLLIRQIRPLPRRVVYPLWALAFFRLVIPFTPSTGWSLFNYTGGLVKRLITVETISKTMSPDAALPPGSDSLMAVNMVGAVNQYAPIEYKTETLRQVFTIASGIWAAVAVALLLAVCVLYLLSQKELRTAVRIKGNLYSSDLLQSPVLAGLLRPRIILPTSLDPQSTECRMILTHENTHRRRLDNLWRLLALCVTCLHWFNPLVWVMLKLFLTDMELACDETVIRAYTTEERKVYANTLLDFAEGRQLLLSAAFGRSGIRLRIVNVLNYKRLTLLGVAASSLFLLVVALALITNPQV